MEIKTFDDILKLREEFAAALQRQVKRLEQAGAGTLDEIIEEKRAALERTKARLDAATQEKAETLKRVEGEVRRRQDAVTRLERDIEELRKTRKTGEKPEPGKPRAKGQRRPPE